MKSAAFPKNQYDHSERIGLRSMLRRCRSQGKNEKTEKRDGKDWPPEAYRKNKPEKE